MEQTLLEKILEAKEREQRPKNRQQEELLCMFRGEKYRNINQEILNVNEEGIITIQRGRTTYQLQKVDRSPKRWDFIFFKNEEYKSSWFKKNKGNLFLVKKIEANYPHFDDMEGFEAYLGHKHYDTYEVVSRQRR